MIPGYPRGSGSHTHEWNGLDSKIIGSDAESIFPVWDMGVPANWFLAGIQI